MTHSPHPLDVVVLKIAAWCSAAALFASAVAAALMGAGALRGTPTRFAVLGVAALAFVNWLLRLRLSLGRAARGAHDTGASSQRVPDECGEFNV